VNGVHSALAARARLVQGVATMQTITVTRDSKFWRTRLGHSAGARASAGEIDLR
jgi:hypothetical protein